jgi:alkaline phosphatase
LESAKALGYLTALIATSRVTHATPAAFCSHVASRESESEIAAQQIRGLPTLGTRSQVDLLMGGGQCFFQPGMNRMTFL